MAAAWVPLLAALVAGLPADLPDRGVFSSLDERVSLAAPAWASFHVAGLAEDRGRHVVTLLFDGEPVKAYPITATCAGKALACLRAEDRDELRAILKNDEPVAVAPLAIPDADGDGIADAVDILIGAKKTVLLRSEYKQTAPKLAYPGGDVPRDVGVCTDVVVRALRNAGIDLQREVFEDAGRAPKAYPGIDRRNSSLDHRRVRNLAVYFKRHFRPVQRIDELLPGDVVLLDTFPSKPGPDHIGIVSDTLGASRRPLIINAWTYGHYTAEMDLLASIPMTVAYRASTRKATTAIPTATTGGTPAGPLPWSTRQLVLVVTERWTDVRGRLSLWERDRHGAWRRRSPPRHVTVGAAGLGWGRGLHADEAADTFGGPRKSEGDGRAPAGIFRLSSATGYDASPPPGTKLPYRTATDALRCVDDPASGDYNQLREAPTGRLPAWQSDERMRRSDDQYRLTVVVDHNRDPVVPGQGSCIFLHAWPAPGLPSPGCTMMSLTDLRDVLAWLDPGAHPVLVQLPQPIAGNIARALGLPSDIP